MMRDGVPRVPLLWNCPRGLRSRMRDLPIAGVSLALRLYHDNLISLSILASSYTLLS